MTSFNPVFGGISKWTPDELPPRPPWPVLGEPPQRSGIAPILKWAGGKRQRLEPLLRNTRATDGTYIEPFFGGGATSFLPFVAKFGFSVG